MPGPVWIDAIAFDTSKNPPERTPAPEPEQVRTSAPVEPSGPPSLADLFGVTATVREAFAAVREASPRFWAFEPRTDAGALAGLVLSPEECRWFDLGKPSEWELVDGEEIPFVSFVGRATDLPGLPELMLAIRELSRTGARCSATDPEQATFALLVNRLCEQPWAAGPIELFDGNRVRVPVAYPVNKLEALHQWAETAAKGVTVSDNERRVLRCLLDGPVPFGMLAVELGTDDSLLGRRLKALKEKRLVVGGDGEHWKLTAFGRAAIGST